MKKLLFVCALFLPHISFAEELSTKMAEAGQELFNKHCVSCHGERAKGDGPVASALVKTPADLTAIAKKSGGDFPTLKVSQYIDGSIEIASHGTRIMPVWGEILAPQLESEVGKEIARGKIEALVEYLKSIQAK